MSKEIERLLREDIRDKKRIGSNIFKRTGKRGYVGAVRFAYNNLSAKEKREYTKSGEVTKYNMQDVMPFERLQTFSKDKQKELVEQWRKSYRNDEIIEKMKIPKQQFYDLLNELDVKKKAGVVYIEKKRYPQEQIEFWKDNMIEYEVFKTLERDQQWELLQNYEKQFKPQELADLWNVKISTVYSSRSNIKKWTEQQEISNQEQEKINKKNKDVSVNKTQKSRDDRLNQKQTSLLDFTEDKKDAVNEGTPKIETVHQEVQTVLEKANVEEPLPYKKLEDKQNKRIASFRLKKQEEQDTLSHGMNLSINGNFLTSELELKLSKLIQMISGENSKYQVSINIQEVERLEQSDLPKPKVESTSMPKSVDKNQQILKVLEAVIHTMN